MFQWTHSIEIEHEKIFIKKFAKPIQKWSCKITELLEWKLETVKNKLKVNKSQTGNKKKILHEASYQKLKIKYLN